MTETIDSKTRQQNQQAYQEYIEQLESRSQESEKRKQTLEALDKLREGRASHQDPGSDVENKQLTYEDPTESRMRKFQKKAAPYQTWGSMAAIPLIAKDSFAPMLGGTEFAKNAREYRFNRRVNIKERGANVDREEATRLVGRLDSEQTKGMSSSEIENAAKENYFQRIGSPLTESEAVRFAKSDITKSSSQVGGIKEAQYNYLGMRRPEDGPSPLDQMVHDARTKLHEVKQLANEKLGTSFDGNAPSSLKQPTDYSTSALASKVKDKAISDFDSNQTGVRSSIGKLLYGNSSERQGLLKNFPMDLSKDTAVGSAVHAAGSAANIGLTGMPALSVGLGSASQMNKLQNLRKDRDLTGKAGKVAETGMTAANLTRAGIFGPAATLMAAPAFSALTKGAGSLAGDGVSKGFDTIGNIAGAPLNAVGRGISSLGGDIPGLSHMAQMAGAMPKAAGSAIDAGITSAGHAAGGGLNLASQGAGNLMEAGGHGLYRAAKDSAFGLTSSLGGGVLKGVSGIANKLGGDGVNLGGSLAAAAKGTGFGATMAGLAPSLIGGLGLAAPGIVGGIASGVADKRRKMMRGFKQPTNQLVKQFSRSRGIDSVLRNLFSANEITSDRMIELQLLMYIEQNTSTIPKLVSDSGLMSDRQEKDSNATLTEYQTQQETADKKSSMFDRAGRGMKYAWSRGLTDLQDVSHSLNIPAQFMDLIINRKTPWARKEEFRQAREDASSEFRDPDHFRKQAAKLGTSASHVKLLSMSSTQLIRAAGAESSEAQQVALQAAIFDLLRHQFSLSAEKSHPGVEITRKSDIPELTGMQKIMHSIPGLSSVRSAWDVGSKLTGKGKGALDFIKNIGPNLQQISGDFNNLLEGNSGEQQTKVGSLLSRVIFGKNQIDKFSKDKEVKAKFGLTKSDDDKINAFKIKLPDLWGELLHLNRLTVDALHNIFNVGNVMLRMTGTGINFQSSGSEAKVFDPHSGEYYTSDQYNEMIGQRRQSFSDQMGDVEHDWKTKLSRKFFGKKHADAKFEDKLSDMFEKDDDFKRKTTSQYGSFVIDAEFNPQRDDSSPQISRPQRDDSSPQIPRPQRDDSSDESASNPKSFLHNIWEKSRESVRNVWESSRSATDELNEQETEEEKKKRESARKEQKNFFKTVLKVLRKGFGTEKVTGDKKSGLFGGIMTALAPLVATLTPIIAPLLTITAGMGALLTWAGFDRKGEGMGPSEALLDKIQDIGVLKNIGSNVIDKAKNIGSSAIDNAKKLGSGVVDKGKKLGQFITGAPSKVMEKFRGGGIFAKSAAGTVSGIGKIASVASKYNPALMAADQGTRFIEDLKDPSRIDKRHKSYTEEFNDSGMVGKGWAVTKKALNPYESIMLANTEVMNQIGKLTNSLFGGDKSKDIPEDKTKPDNKIEKKQEEIQKLRKQKEKEEESPSTGKKKDLFGGLVTGLVDKFKDTPEDNIDKKKALFAGLVDKFKGKSEDDAGAGYKWKRIDHDFGTTWKKVPVKDRDNEISLDKKKKGLFPGLIHEIFSNDKQKDIQGDPIHISATHRKKLFDKQYSAAQNEHRKNIAKTKHLEKGGIKPLSNDVLSMRKQFKDAMDTSIDDQYFSKAVPFKGNLNVEQMKRANADNLHPRDIEELPTIKEKRREAAQVQIPSHSSAPSAINAGVAGSKSQITKDRAINPEIESFIDNLFVNTIVVFQQSIKSFAIGQTPFQILR